MCKRRFPDALQSSGSYVQFIIQCRRKRTRLSSSRWYCRGWTTEMPSWPVFLPTCFGDSSRWWTRQHGSSTACVTRTTCTYNIPLAPGSGQERVLFVLMYKATHGTAPSYPSQLVRVTDLPGRRSLRSARTNRLLVRPVKLSAVRRWNRNEVPRGSSDKELNQWPTSLRKFTAEAFNGPRVSKAVILFSSRHEVHDKYINSQ